MERSDVLSSVGNISSMRRYSLAQLDVIDFSTSDDFAIVVENMKKLIILKTEVEDVWNEEHEQNLWQFVIDPDSTIFFCYATDKKLISSFSISSVPVGEFFYFIKTSADELVSKEYDLKIMYGTAKAPYFESLYKLLYKVYFPMFVENIDWSRYIKSDYLQRQSKFLSQIFDLKNELLGELVFYVPKDIILQTAEVMSKDKELLNEIERTVMNWVWLLISMLMRKSHNEFSERCGPIEEIEFWKEKCFVLNKALEQLNRTDAKKCLEILKQQKSGCVSKMLAVHHQIVNEKSMASENVKFLSILEKPCELIKNSPLTHFPEHLNLLLNSVKIIWGNSTYFNRDSEISSLLRKANNFIIDECSKHIPLKSIFSEVNYEQDELILGAIQCCNAWIQIFNTSEQAHKKFAAKSWSVESVATLMNLFIHRCEELLKITEYKKLFKCDFEKDNYAKGHKCFEVADQFGAIESYFCNLLKELSKYQNSCLDIHTTVWNDHFKKFKEEVCDLEMDVAKLMSNSLDSSSGIDEGIQILIMFKKYFKKEMMKKDLRKCTKSLYDIFFNEITFIKKKIFESKRSSNPLLPTYGGAAFCLYQLPKNLKLQYQILKSSSYLWDKDYCINIEDQYHQTLEAVNESIHTLYLQWIKTIPKDPYNWLKNPMIIKTESSHFIQINTESDIINFIEELFYWDKSGIEMPKQILKFFDKSEVFLKRIFRIMQAVKCYNRVVSSLCAVNTESMFNDALKSLEETVLPSLSSLNWSSPQANLNSSLRSLSEQTKLINDSFAHFEESNSKISSICKKIGKKCLFLGNLESLMEFLEFVEVQKTFRKNVLEEVHALSLDIIGIAQKLQNVYKKKNPEDEHYCVKYMEIVGKKICDSLVESFLTTLKAVSTLFGINRKNKMRIVLKMFLSLKNSELHFSPTFKELCCGIDNLIESIGKDLACVLNSEKAFFENDTVENKFHEMVQSSDSIKEVKEKIDFGLYKLYEAQKNYEGEWKPFSCLWELDKAGVFTDYEEKGWKGPYFQKDINEFMKIAEKIHHIQRYKSLDFCISDCNKLKEMAIVCAGEWKKESGSVFNAIACSNLQNAYDLIDLSSKKFTIIPKTLEELKHCIKNLSNSKVASLKIQSTFKSIHEIFFVLKEFNISISEKALDQEKNLEKNWKNLEDKFKNYYVELQKIQASHQRHLLEFHAKLENQAIFLQENLHVYGPFQLKWDFSNALHKILYFKKQLIGLKEKELWMKRDTIFLHLTLNPINTLKSVELELNNVRFAWMYASQIDELRLEWEELSLLNFNVHEKKNSSHHYKKLVKELKEKVKESHWIILDELMFKLDKLEECYTIILNFQEPTLQKRHWEDLKTILELPPDEPINFFQSRRFSFGFLENIEVENLVEKTNMIALQARKENEIEENLKKMERMWETEEFDMSPYKSFYKLEDTENIVSFVEDNQTSLTTMKLSRYVSYFSEEIDSLENSLSLILDVIDQANVFQSKFFFFENIFSEQTVQAQLPKESIDFQDLTSLWETVSVSMQKKKLVWKTSHQEGFLTTLVEMNEKIQGVQKSLEAYLESKRRAFPRFYFISNDDLLSIIGQKSPKDIQPYLKQCFSGIHFLEIVEIIEEKKRKQDIIIKVTGMHSNCKEYVEFFSSIILDGPIESWMLDVEEMMQITLNGLLPKCLAVFLMNLEKEDFNFTEIKWLYNWPGQICLLAMEIAWTAETTAAIKIVQESAIIAPLKSLMKKWKEILSQFIKKLASESLVLVQMKCMMMITTLINMKDIIDYLIKCVCNDPCAFEWLVQLRFFYDDDKEECFVQQTKAILKYGFEYLGSRERIVITPLTDRCFVSITTAFLLHQGILMKGSKASGKTETLRELGLTVGNYVVVINCSENLTQVSLVRMLSGIAQIGAWGIFEEFDNVKFEILSILNQQISTIFQALSLGNGYFSFLGKESLLNEKCGIFLVVNAERSMSTYDMPLVLSDIFRPVTMISPDILTVIQVYLHAYGFLDSKTIARDIYLIFKLTKEQLSVQNHYDFGLRAVINFLKYLRSIMKVSDGSSNTDKLIASFKSTVVPKLVLDDVSVFQSVLENIFGSVKSVIKDDFYFKNCVGEVLRQNSLEYSDSQVEKVMAFYEMTKVCHAIILLGDSGSGKSTTWKILKEVHSHLETSSEKLNSKITPVHVYRFNPKAYSSQELFGHYNEKEDWIDGLFPSIMREACHNSRSRDKWIIFEGPIDMEWIKNISSLLDSTKILTLANGERILLPKEIYLLFEATELTHCSPSAVSCCGIIYHQSGSISWEAYFYTWLKKIENKSISQIIRNLAGKYLDAIVEFPFKSLEPSKVMFTNHIHCVASFCKLLDSLLKKVCNEPILSETLFRIFWFSIVWSIGSAIDERGQRLLNEFVHTLNDALPRQGSIFDYGLNENFEWIKWNNLVPLYQCPDERIPLEKIMVPTKVTVAYQYIIKNLVDEMNPVFLVGNMCSGKTTLLHNLLRSLNAENYEQITMNVSCQSTSIKLQYAVESQMIKKAGNIYVPDFQKKLIVFLDDLNLAALNESNSVSFLELLNMQLNCKYWFDRKKWKTNKIQNVVFLCSMTSEGSIEGFPSKCLLSHFNVIYLNSASDSEMKHIFISLLKNKFSDVSLEIRTLINAISLACLDAIKAATSLFFPTPSKLHYLFSMHDIKKVIFRMLEVNPETISNKTIMTKFWLHECLREFSDKLITEEEKTILFHTLKEVIGNQFLIQLSRLNIETKPIFARFLNQSKSYEEVENLRELRHKIETSIKDYKRIYTNLPLVLFDHAVEHLYHIIRGIEVPYGNMFLIGFTGTGRLTLSRLAAYILKYEVFEIQLKKNYGISDFKKDLRSLFCTCGIKKRNIMFLVSDFQIICDEFLQYLAETVISGEITDLFKQSELKKIYAEIREEFELESIAEKECHRIFTENIKRYLHVVFCVNYATPLYKKCIIHYPAVYKYSTCDWFEDWPRTALESISKKLTENFNFPQETEAKNLAYEILPELHEVIVKCTRDKMRASVKIFHTSTTFITFVNTFKNALTKKSKKVQQALERLESGLIKINETQEKVNEIARETEEARLKLIVSEKECDQALIDIQAQKAIVAEKQETIQEKKIEIERNEKICKKIAIAAQEDLNAALPALEEARKALEALNKRDVSEIKSYAKPPILVEIVLEAVMILRNSEPSWAEAKRQLGSPSFLKELIEYDRDNILDSSLKKIEKYIHKPEFQPQIIGKVSVAAKSLCIWVHAMHLYGEIYKRVKPKKERLRIAQEEVARLQAILFGLLRELEELKAFIERLEREHKIQLKKKEEYARTARILALKLERANSIMQGLNSEKKRWSDNVIVFSEKKKFVLGDSLMAAGFVTYLGPHDPYFRIKTCNIWKRIIIIKELLCSPEFDLADYFIDTNIMTEWTMYGLPNDQYSHEGAAIVTESYSCPFIIDPERQALKWIKNMEAKQCLKLCNLQGSKWLSILENAIVEGYPVLLEIMNAQLESTLEPLFSIAYADSKIVFNNKELVLHKNFCLYILTKASSPQFSPSLIKHVCIVNFTIKEKGLEDQLLPLVVHNERSDLEVTKEKLVKSIMESKKQLLEIENTILRLLSESRGSLLDDESLVEALNKSKSTSIEVEEKLMSSEKTENVIDAAREKYRPAAKNAAILYFVLSDMTAVESIYVFTLDSYICLFLDSISKSPKDPDVIRRIRKLKVFHQYAVFKYACRTVSEKHFLLLSFHMCCRILNGEGTLDKDEYDYFIHGGKDFDPTTDPPNPCSHWLPQSCWVNIIQLERLPKFIGITVSLDEISRNWQEWYLTSEPEKNFLPGNWRNICSEFQRLLIIRSLRVDRITNCVRTYILNNLGKRFVEYPHMSFSEVIKKSVANIPVVLFLLSNDVDIEDIVSEQAKNFEMSDRYRAISLGEGQGSVAAQLIVDAAKLGFWALIFNCHQLLSWMPALEKIVDKLRTIKVNPEFRLFLGSSLTEFFPASILQNSITLTFDAPKGIRENMLKLYKMNASEESELNSSEMKFRSLFFSLSFFHSILVERKKFQNVGWNADYNFTVADFKASVKMLQLYLHEYKEMPWDALRNSIAGVCYKKHLRDERDERLLITYYEQFFCDEACSNSKFQFTDLNSYYVPEDGPIESYLSYIKSLPTIDVPEVFGQHTNSEILYRIQEGELLLHHLSKIQGDVLIQKEENIDNQMIKIINDIQHEIPKEIKEEEAMSILQENRDPFNFILVQEIKRYNVLLNLVKKSLNYLEDNITGKQRMTEKAEKILNFIQRMEVPHKWKFAYPSSKPLGSWLQDLKLRIAQLQTWSSTGSPPIKFWLPGFTSPISFLNATLLTAVKNSDIMLKDLEWEYHVSTLDEAHIKEAPVEGIYVRGLFLEGAGWDKTNSLLIDPEPLNLVSPMPVIHFKPVIESSLRGLYKCPCYYTSERNDLGSSYLFDIELKSKKPKEYWIKRGTAIILSSCD